MTQHTNTVEEELYLIESFLMTGKHTTATEKCLAQLEALHQENHKLHRHKHEMEEDEYTTQKRLIRER
jgi:hypothetical protein